jgi:hypothetical protein
LQRARGPTLGVAPAEDRTVRNAVSAAWVPAAMSHDTVEGIEALVRAFESATVPKEAWTHEAHLVVALSYVREHGPEAATLRMREGILRLNAALGGPPTAYHETVTRAYITLIASFVDQHDAGQSFDVLLQLLLERCRDRHCLLQFYSRELLGSQGARERWIPPDVRPITF